MTYLRVFSRGSYKLWVPYIIEKGVTGDVLCRFVGLTLGLSEDQRWQYHSFSAALIAPQVHLSAVCILPFVSFYYYDYDIILDATA